ncbi:hypothetical protein [Reyranella soli]|nr:hypothetical protein [Reyranella soli]
MDEGRTDQLVFFAFDLPLAKPPPSDGRFGFPLNLPRVHWVRAPRSLWK